MKKNKKSLFIVVPDESSDSPSIGRNAKVDSMSGKVADPDQNLTKMKRIPSVHLVVTSAAGAVLMMVGGENAHIPVLLNDYASRPSGERFSVEKQDGFTAYQDIFQVSRSFVLSIRGTFTFMSHAEIERLDTLLPESGFFTFVLSY